MVTGGGGFLGSHLCDRLLAEGWDVACLDRLGLTVLDPGPELILEKEKRPSRGGRYLSSFEILCSRWGHTAANLEGRFRPTCRCCQDSSHRA